MYKIEDIINKVHCADCLEFMKDIPDKSVDCIITSPPYYTTQHKYQRGSGFHYSTDIGEPLYLIEDSADELYRVLKEDGALALNLGFSYGETGILRPYRIIDRFLKKQWFPFDCIIWHKNNPIPIRERLTNAYEYIFILTKMPNFKYKRKINYEHNVWKFPVESKDLGTASFPEVLPQNILDILTKEGDIVLDPFGGSGTTGLVALTMNRKYILIEINPTYCEAAKNRLKQKNLI